MNWLEHLKKFWAEAITKLGFQVPADKQSVVDQVLADFVKQIEEGQKKDDPKMDNSALDALTKALKEALGAKEEKEDENKDDPKKDDQKEQGMDIVKLTSAITNSLKPIADEVTALKKSLEERSKLDLTSKVTTTLEQAFKDGKFGNADYAFWKKSLEDSYDLTNQILEKMPADSMLAKKNSTEKPGEEYKEEKEPNEMQKKESVYKKYSTPMARQIDTKLLEYVEQSANS